VDVLAVWFNVSEVHNNKLFLKITNICHLQHNLGCETNTVKAQINEAAQETQEE